MTQVPEGLWRKYSGLLAERGISGSGERAYGKWLRYYLDFCRKYGHGYADSASIAPFLDKLASKQQTEAQRKQAESAVQLYHEMLSGRERLPSREELPELGVRESDAGVVGGEARSWAGASWREEYTRLANEIKLRHYSPKTLKAYTAWARKFQAFLGSPSPETLSTDDVKRFLTDLAVRQRVSASTQNQGFNALLFFFRHVLGREFGEIDGVVRAKRRRYIPVVLSREEIDRIVGFLSPPFDLLVKLLYGCGLRISECLGLRVGCFNLDAGVLTVHDGKGQKDRTMPLPQILLSEIRERLKELSALHRADLGKGYAGVFLPSQLEKKYRNAPKEFVWQWFFPAKRLTHVVKDGEYRRYHLQPSQVGNALRAAVGQAAIPKRVSAHTFRHSFASHLLQANYDIVTIQRLLGHSSVKTTMIYTQTVPSITLKDAKSPLDL